MDEVYSLEQQVNYFLVDQDHKLRLSSLFQLLQEAAIHHANQYHIGTGIMHSKGESGTGHGGRRRLQSNQQGVPCSPGGG